MQETTLIRWPAYWKTASAVCVLLMMAAIGANAQTFTTLLSFNYATDGESPAAALVQGTDGNLYGTARFGGANESGTIFRISPSGTITVLYNFRVNNPEGSVPSAALVQGADGNFYGTTQLGGSDGQGSAFKITPSGTLTTLYSFCSQGGCADGGQPASALIQASDGSFYGTTDFGGANACSGGCGTVFKITPSGTLTTLYNFCSQGSFFCTDGAYPYGGLVQATDGSFYGTTGGGGANNPPYGSGTVFKISPSGTLTTLYSFCSQSGCTDGAVPVAGLVQATDGNFYGTTRDGGANETCTGFGVGCGTVFKITPTGTLTTLYGFCSQSGCTDGEAPAAGLVQATDGNFYGTTFAGGADGGGTVFKITRSGALTTLYSFCSQDGCTDGLNPYAALVQDTNGTFYGTAYYGGANGSGTVFSLSVGLRPFVGTQPTSGKVGAAVNILGTNLTGATSVSFNGTAATFTVVSKSEITTTVPEGATTGKVDVTTPSGTLSSNVIFRVKP